MHRGPHDQTGGEPFPLVAEAWPGGEPGVAGEVAATSPLYDGVVLPGER
jgi:hypothetical protein